MIQQRDKRTVFTEVHETVKHIQKPKDDSMDGSRLGRYDHGFQFCLKCRKPLDRNTPTPL